MNGGRPLRFLLVTLGGWSAVRMALLWPSVEPVAALIAGPAMARTQPASVPVRSPGPVGLVPHGPAVAAMPFVAPASAFAASTPPLGRSPVAVSPSGPIATYAAMPAAAVVPAGAVPAAREAVAQDVILARPASVPSGRSRLSGSGWALLRGGDDDGGTDGRLGGAQAGARLTFALGTARRVALAARVSSPLAGRGREAAIGIDWQPTRLPIHLLAEQRMAIGRGRAGPALSLVGGLDALPVAAGFRLEAYGQAGAVRGAGAFVDGAVRLARPVGQAGGLRLDLGLGGWGGAQRGAARLDVGPGAVLVLPVADRAVRLSLDWRQRIAGTAQPGSGPVLAIGHDF